MKRMKMKIVLLIGLTLCTFAVNAENATIHALHHANDRDKRDVTAEETQAPVQYYRTPRKQKPVAPVEELHDGFDEPASGSNQEEYRPGQVFSLNTQELLDLQPERKAPLAGGQQLQQIYAEPQQEHKQNIQQFYYLEPQAARQALQPSSHAVITRPDHSSDGGEASVGAALSVSDTAARSSDTFDQELLALLGQVQGRPEERHQIYQQAPQAEQTQSQSIATQYQQIDRFSIKPSKKPTKLRAKTHFAPPQSSTAPQQYLIETTNVQQIQQPQHQQLQQQQQQQYQQASQPQRPTHALRFVQVPAQATAQQLYFDYPEHQGIKVVAAPKLQQPRAQLNYRTQYQQPEASPKQYRIIEAQRAPIRQEQTRIQTLGNERPITYLKRFPEPEKLRSVKFYDAAAADLPLPQQPAQIAGEQYYIRQVNRPSELRDRYSLHNLPTGPVEQTRTLEPTKPPHSSIYVNKNVAPKKIFRTQPFSRAEPPTRLQQVNIEQHGQNADTDRSNLPPPRNNKAYTPEEFAALVAAGYAVTPIPVSALGYQDAQSRSDEISTQIQRRPYRANPYLPLRADEGP